MPDFSQSTLAVSGAGGNLGRRIVEILLERGASKVIAVTRTPEKLSDLRARGVDVRRGDLDDAASLDSALIGAERVLVISGGDIMAPGGRIAQNVRAIDAAVRAGARHVMYTSISSPHPTPTALVARDHFFTEAHLAGLDIDWSLLRNNIYTEMLLDGGRRAIASGALVHAAGGGATNHVTREDCAAAAAGALLSAEGRTVFDVTGPEPQSKAQIAAILSEISGKPIVAQAIPAEAMLGGMVGAGLPEVLAKTFLHFDTDAEAGYFAVTGNAVERLTGRRPTSVAEFLKANATALLS